MSEKTVTKKEGEEKEPVGISLSSFLNMLLIAGMTLTLSYSLYIAHQTLNAPPVTSGLAESASLNQAPTLPPLRENVIHKRKGPVVNVDKNNIGKDNPFVAR